MGDDAVQLIYLLKGEALGLIDQGPHETDADQAEGRPNEEDLRLEVGVLRVDHVRCGVRDGPVEQPIAGGRHGEALGADLEREELACHDPGDRAPRAGEEIDVKADKRDGSTLSGEILGTRYGADDGDDVLADTHSNGTQKEQVAAAKLLDEVQAWEGRDDVDSVGDDLDDKRVLEAGALEVLGAIVEDEIDTSELLQPLETTARGKALENSALEAIGVARSADAHLILVISLDLGQLFNNSRMGRLETP